MKSGEVALGIFEDYSKTFDIIDFDIMLCKTYEFDFLQTFYVGHLVIQN